MWPFYAIIKNDSACGICNLRCKMSCLKINPLAPFSNYFFKGVKATEAAPVRFAWYIHSLRPFLNHVNVIRASIDHLSLDAEKGDPPSRRPQLLVIATRDKSQPLQPAFVASSLANFGSVDVRPLTANSVCVAVGTLRVYKDVIEFCAKSDKMACFRYRPYKHSKTVRSVLWGVVAASGLVCFWVLFVK